MIPYRLSRKAAVLAAVFARMHRHRVRRTVLAVSATSALVLGVLIALPGTALAAGSLPCDIYAVAGTPCVAAHSTVRALYSSYDGSLYQVKRASDNATENIGLLSAGGYADSAAQNQFCARTSCIITEIFDQSGKGNNLTIEGPGGNGGQDMGANASALPVIVGGNKVYGLYVSPGVGYRDNNTTGIATGGQAQGEYMVASGTHVNSGCCFDYGNAESNSDDNGNGHMEAVNLGTTCYFGPCTGNGPWVAADLENGLYQGAGSNTGDGGNSSDFVTALLKSNGQSTFALKGGDAQTGGLTTWYNGPLPSGGYTPMHLEGGIVLGTGGDNSNASIGSFFEGVMTSGEPTDAADNAVQANIVAAGYALGTAGEYVSAASGRCLDDPAGSMTPGVLQEIWDCHHGANQEWTHTGSDQLQALGMCLDAFGQGTTAGTGVDLWPCNGQANQQWNINSNGTITGVQSGLCLDVKGGGDSSDGTPIDIWPCNGGTNQQWSTA